MQLMIKIYALDLKTFFKRGLKTMYKILIDSEHVKKSLPAFYLATTILFLISDKKYHIILLSFLI